MTVDTNNAEIFLHTLREFLESEGRHDLVMLLTPARVVFHYSMDFTGRQWNQRSVFIEFKVPVHAKKKVEKYGRDLERYCHQVYEDTQEYGLVGIQVGVMQLRALEVKQDDTIEVVAQKTQVYNNMLAKINNSPMDPIEKNYIFEACLCALQGCRLAAATMLGCAAEQLLLLLSRAYLEYLKNGNGTEAETSNFESRVVNASKAHTRLDGFKRTVQNKEKLFQELGLENSNLHFQFLDIIRQVRNESGHPTGLIPPEEDLSTIFGNYQLLISRVHPLITKLPTYSNVAQ